MAQARFETLKVFSGLDRRNDEFSAASAEMGEKMILTARQQKVVDSTAWILGGVFLMCLFSGMALADGNLEGTVDAAMERIQGLVKKIAGVVLVIGLIVVGLKFSRGDQSAGQHAMLWGVGALVVYAASEILEMFGA